MGLSILQFYGQSLEFSELWCIYVPEVCYNLSKQCSMILHFILFFAQCKSVRLWFPVYKGLKEGAQWLSGRVLDSRPKGRGFEPHRRHCVAVLVQDTFILAKHWFNPGRPVPV